MILLLALCWIAVYAFLYLHFSRCLRQLYHVGQATQEVEEAKLPGISLCIALRNEQAQLAQLKEQLQSLDYPTDKLEIILIDDHSTDGTFRALQEMTFPFACHCLRMPPQGRGKKAAITYAVSQASKEWVVQTDADTQWPSDYLQAIARSIQAQPHAKVLIGPLSMEGAEKTWHYVDQMELMALSGTALALAYEGQPLLANGANLAYRRQWFIDLKAYASNSHLASGDDMFLILKSQQRAPGSVGFMQVPQSKVQVKPAEKIGTFLEQRLRWSNKWNQYDNWKLPALAVLIFGANVFVLYSLGVWLFASFSDRSLLVVSLKVLVDYYFLQRVHRYWHQKFSIKGFLLGSLLYPIYSVGMGLAANLKKSYHWKGRKSR